MVGLDDQYKQQGKILAYLVAEGEEDRCKRGKPMISNVICVEDGYYQHWLDGTFGAYRIDRRIPLHSTSRTYRSPAEMQDPQPPKLTPALKLNRLGVLITKAAECAAIGRTIEQKNC